MCPCSACVAVVTPTTTATVHPPPTVYASLVPLIGTYAERYGKHSLANTSHVHLDIARRCTEVVNYSSPRRYGFYVQNNRKVPIVRNFLFLSFFHEGTQGNFEVVI